jgi:hypothetical protein
VKAERVRSIAMALPSVAEEPHFTFSSFRVAGKIFATLPPDGTHLHVFVDDEQRQLAIALEPGFLEILTWGQRVVGLRVRLSKATPAMVTKLLAQAWSRKAPKRLLAANAPGVETQVDAFLGKYTAAVESQLRDARARLRAMFPRGFELVFDNYNALVFRISPTERTSDAFISVAGYPRWVTLFFLHGASLRDPHGLLVGEGKQVRSIRLADAAQLDRADVQDLIAQAVRPHTSALRAAPPLGTIVKSVLATQRPRRPASR